VRGSRDRGQGREVAQTMSTHINKYKNNIKQIWKGKGLVASLYCKLCSSKKPTRLCIKHSKAKRSGGALPNRHKALSSNSSTTKKINI
jgi:hypothetical protein